jgi:hypothetical protein
VIRYMSVPDFPGYRVGDDGSVLTSLQQFGPGIGWQPTENWRPMNPSIHSFGYPQVTLCNKGRMVKVTVHSLVLTLFVGPKPEGMECCHRNRNPKDCRLENLYWGTHADNAADMVRHGTSNRGSYHPMVKLSEEDVLAIRAGHAAGKPSSQMGAEFGVSARNIRRITSGERWKHLLPKT